MPDDAQPIQSGSSSAEQSGRDPEAMLAEHPESVGLVVGGRPPWHRRLRKFFCLDNHSGSASLIWFCPAYVVDWGVGLVGVIVSKLYLEPLKPYHRDLSLYYHLAEYHGSLRPEQVSDEWLQNLSVILPLLVLILLTLISYPTGGIHLLPTLHHSMLGLLVSHALATVSANLLKVWVGELRPDFFSRCSYSETTHICTPHFHNIKLLEDGMKSFTSGHSCTAFAGLGFLSLWIAGRNGAFAIGGDGLRRTGPLQSRLLKGLVASIWLVLASWISITRIQDHRHHPRDVIAGSLIGSLSALLAYILYHPSPFNGDLLGTSMGKPRLVYAHDLSVRPAAPLDTAPERESST